MEEPVMNEQTSASVGKSKLRYPLRSASKSKDQNSKFPEFANNSSSANSKRGRNSNMSKSVSVLELSGKGKDKAAAKPPRRQSIPSKSSVSPQQKSACNITPISEARLKRSNNGQERCDTPLSDVSRSSVRRKFNILSSASYWLSQIKLSESASKHSISLGFFKLALEAGSEPMQRLREELKSYVQRHNLAELGETVKSLQESVTCSHVPEDAEDVQSTSSTAATKKFKPKSLNTDTQASSAKASPKESVPRITSATKLRASVNLDSVKPKLVTESKGNSMKKDLKKPGKQELNNGDKIKKQGEKSASEEVTAKALDTEGDHLKETKKTWMLHTWRGQCDRSKLGLPRCSL
ncbi:Cytoskeleton-associated protein 2-like [Bienertia sinuspersici]